MELNIKWRVTKRIKQYYSQNLYQFGNREIRMLIINPIVPTVNMYWEKSRELPKNECSLICCFILLVVGLKRHEIFSAAYKYVSNMGMLYILMNCSLIEITIFSFSLSVIYLLYRYEINLFLKLILNTNLWNYKSDWIEI